MQPLVPHGRRLEKTSLGDVSLKTSKSAPRTRGCLQYGPRARRQFNPGEEGVHEHIKKSEARYWKLLPEYVVLRSLKEEQPLTKVEDYLARTTVVT